MDKKEQKIWLPPKGLKKMNWEDAKKWYNNISIELDSDFIAEKDKKIFAEYYREAGLFNNPLKHDFFHYHYSHKLPYVINALLNGKAEKMKILDLGCGSGSQSLLFAILGAKVVGIDLDVDALCIFKARKSFYEKIIGRNLDIEIIKADVFEFDYKSYGPFDAVYSLFSFNMMQPTSKLLELMSPNLTDNAIILIQDGNKNMWFNKLFRRRNALSRAELQEALKKMNFVDFESIGGYAIPPVLWAFIPNDLLKVLDERLVRLETISVSYLHMAKRIKS